VPRAGLNRAIVVAEAAAIADRAGYDGMTLSAIADHFSVAVPSLYKHVAGRDDLRRALAIQSIEELGDRLSAAAEGAPDGRRLHAVAVAYRDFAAMHPGRYAATVRRAPDPDDDVAAATGRVLETVLAVLADYGLAGSAAIDAARAVRSAIHGFVDIEAAGGFGLPRGVDRSFAAMIDLLDAALGSGIEVGRTISDLPRRPR
jgi:AcrR family transcriptional regulator